VGTIRDAETGLAAGVKKGEFEPGLAERIWEYCARAVDLVPRHYARDEVCVLISS